MHVFVDTSVKGCNIALFDHEGLVLACVQEPIERGHAETLLPAYEGLMQNLNKQSKDIESVYVTVGPGSFTGLRVGLTVARFIGFSLGVPVHGLSTFSCFSASYNDTASRLILIETKRSDYYAQIMDDHHNPVGDAQSLSGEDVVSLLSGQTDIHIIGDAVNRFKDEFPDVDRAMCQMDMIDIVPVVKAISNQAIELLKPEAFYIRDADVSQPKKKF